MSLYIKQMRLHKCDYYFQHLIETACQLVNLFYYIYSTSGDKMWNIPPFFSNTWWNLHKYVN